MDLANILYVLHIIPSTCDNILAFHGVKMYLVASICPSKIPISVQHKMSRNFGVFLAIIGSVDLANIY